MIEKEIITEFVNSDSFPIIHNFVSKPYEETINEMQQDKDNFIKFLEDRYNFLQNIENPNSVAIGRRDEIKNILERIKNSNYE